MSSEPPPPSPPPDAGPLLTSPPLPEPHPRSSNLTPSSDSPDAPTPAAKDDDADRSRLSGTAADDSRAGPPRADSTSIGAPRDETMEEEADGPEEGGSVGSSSSSTTGDKRYTLSVVQQPLRSAEFGSHVLSRLPLGPPLIVRLDVADERGNEVNIEPTLPFLFSHISLVPSSTSSESAVDLVTDSSTGSALRMLYGTLVSSPHQLTLAPASRGVYFVFPDVSVKVRGTYRLKVGLMRIAGPPGDPVNPPEHSTLATVITDDFEITSISEYVAPALTAMTGSTSDQGVQMFLPRTA